MKHSGRTNHGPSTCGDNRARALVQSEPLCGAVMVRWIGAAVVAGFLPLATGMLPVASASPTGGTGAGSIVMRDGRTFMMAVVIDDLGHVGGSWLVEVDNEPANGWAPIAGTWAPSSEAARPTRISGYQGSDEQVYIAADSFDRSEGVTMYRVGPEHVTERDQWQPWTGSEWGRPADAATVVSSTNFGELSFREFDGKAVLSGFNVNDGQNGAVEIRVADKPNEIFSKRVAPTVAAQSGDPSRPNYVPYSYGGYIMPGSTLDEMRITVGQWNPDLGQPYNTQLIVANVRPVP